MYSLTTITLLLLIAVLSLQGQQHIFKEQQPKSVLYSPFTYEWTRLLEQFHNAFGSKNTSKDDSKCLYPMPKFDCQPFLWHDGIIDRDAYHLRPMVTEISYLFMFD
jgi:hypothetical protein